MVEERKEIFGESAQMGRVEFGKLGGRLAGADGICGGETASAEGNSICDVALLFCDQKSNQKSLAVSTQRTPTQGASPPRPPKRIKILDFTPKATPGRLLGRNPKFLFE